MAKIIIDGETALCGKVTVSGAKNEALKLIPLSIILDSAVKISNVPRITDVLMQLKILESIGAKFDFEDGILNLDSTKLSGGEIATRLAKKLRASIVLTGPLLARFGKVFCPYPGGCTIGCRSIDSHTDAFEQLGAKVRQNKEHLYISLPRPKGGVVFLKEQSVSATENISLYAASIEATVEIHNSATEPEVIDLMRILKKAGAKIEGIGTTVVKITGTKKLHLPEAKVMPDRIEAATFIIAMLATGGEGEVTPFSSEGLEPFLEVLKESGANIEIKGKSAIVKKTTEFKPFKITTAPHPGFPTDLQSPMALIAARAKGVSTINETMYENRLTYLEELKRAGLDATILNNHKAKIKGPTKFSPTTTRSLDLRSGITLLIAAMMTSGKTILEKSELIDRGYENIDEKLRGLGAKIKRI